MKWGVRRYQNPDGSYTAAGKLRYGKERDTYKHIKEAADSGMSKRQIIRDLSKNATVQTHAKNVANATAHESRSLPGYTPHFVRVDRENKAFNESAKSYARKIVGKKADEPIKIRNREYSSYEFVEKAIRKRARYTLPDVPFHKEDIKFIKYK